MFKSIAVLLLATIGLLLPLGASAMVPRSPSYPTQVYFDNTSTANVNEFSELIASCPGMYLNFKQASDAVISVYNVSPTDDTAALIEANTRITQLNESKVFGPFTPVKKFIRLIVDRRETSSTPSTVDVSCASGAVNFAVPVPAAATDVEALSYTTTSPAAVKSGWNVGFEGPTPAFAGTLYTDTGPEPTPPAASELNQMIGWSYNKGVQGATIPNIFEHAYDFSMENGYRPAGSTIVEFNWDFFPPFISSPVGGASGTFAAGNAITFTSGGVTVGSGIVVSYSGGTLIWRHNYGLTFQGDTVTNQTQAGSGTLGALTQTVGSPINRRPFIFTYNTMDDTSAFDFDTTPNSTAGGPDVSISSGYLRHHGRIVPASVHWNTATWNSGTVVAAGACNTTNVGLSGTGFDGTQSAATDVIRWSFNGDVTGVTGFNPSTGVLSIYAWPGANTVNFKLCNTTAGSLTLGANVTINWIVDRPL